jgi:ABC-2 type transport system ATP-binding protein
VILSTHILPEVSQTCHRVVIINKGRVVAVDTPDNLTTRLGRSASVYVQVDTQGADVGAALAAVAGVSRVSATDDQGPIRAFEVDTEPDRDIRRELAATVVNRGWGLLELRPMRVSLEDIFLQLTTEDPTYDVAAPAVEVADE